MNRIYLKFDTTVEYGSPEHYYHFLLGYLLPCVHTIGGIGRTRPELGREVCIWHLRSCGPLMDRILTEVLTSLGVRYEVSKASDLDECSALETVTVARFDVRCAAIRGRARRHRSDGWFCDMRSAVDSCTALLQGAGDAHARDGAYLLIRRSEQPDYYRRGGAAEIAGYGISRRSLLGIDEAASFLKSTGIDVEVFEPGLHTLATQVDAFRRCRGIIAMRGAELANMVWMRPGAQVLMFHPPMVPAPAPQVAMAELLCLHLVDMPVATRHHRIDPALLERALRHPHLRLMRYWAVIRRTLTASIARLT